MTSGCRNINALTPLVPDYDEFQGVISISLLSPEPLWTVEAKGPPWPCLPSFASWSPFQLLCWFSSITLSNESLSHDRVSHSPSFWHAELIKGKQTRLLNVLCYLRKYQPDLQSPLLFDMWSNPRTAAAARRKLSPVPISEVAMEYNIEGKTPKSKRPKLLKRMVSKGMSSY